MTDIKKFDTRPEMQKAIVNSTDTILTPEY